MSIEAFVADEGGRVGLRNLADELGGDLQSVHQEAGFFLVDAGFAESVAHLLEREADALRSFDGGELQAIVGVLGAIASYVNLLVVKAVNQSAERRIVALPSGRHDVAAPLELEHTDLPGEWQICARSIPLPHLLGVRTLFAMNYEIGSLQVSDGTGFADSMLSSQELVEQRNEDGKAKRLDFRNSAPISIVENLAK